MMVSSTLYIMYTNSLLNEGCGRDKLTSWLVTRDVPGDYGLGNCANSLELGRSNYATKLVSDFGRTGVRWHSVLLTGRLVYDMHALLVPRAISLDAYRSRFAHQCH